MPTRILKKPEKNTRVQAPQRTDDWRKLLHKAIKRAEAIKDKRLTALHGALKSNSSAEKVLRGMGIIHDRDIEREFPPKST